MRRAPLVLILCLGISACGPQLPKEATDLRLTEAVGRAIGDPNTCVVIVDKDGRKAWSGGNRRICADPRPACTRAGTITTADRAAEAAKGAVITTGCEVVSWAAGPVRESGFFYAAGMEGERAMPGREIARRMDQVFEATGF